MRSQVEKIIKEYDFMMSFMKICLKYLSTGVDQSGLQQVPSAPGGLSLPHQVSRRIVGGASA